MSSPRVRALAVGIALGMASIAAYVMIPTRKVSDANATNLEALVPQTFGDWRIDTSVIPIAPSPEVLAEVQKTYTQTLARTYIDPDGHRIMLSVAYGGDQERLLTVHFPEGCYRGQGFEVRGKTTGMIEAGKDKLPVIRLNAQKGPRIEPITYWVLIGDAFVGSSTERKLAQLKYSLTGSIPDGMLVRVSSIGAPAASQYALHDQFIKAMLGAVTPADRKRLVGTFQ